MDFKILNKEGETISFVANAPTEEAAYSLVRTFHGITEGFELVPSEPLNIPEMFTCCIMDQVSIDNFKT
jgi:hypothetical protein